MLASRMFRNHGHGKSSQGWAQALILLLALVFLAAAPVASAGKTAAPAAADQVRTGNGDQQYQAMKEYFAKLDQDAGVRLKREHWLKGVHTFQRIYLAERKGPLGPPSLYMMARMYSRMFALFDQPNDWDLAREHYLQVADLYPGHYLADDALYGAAELLLHAKGDASQATVLLTKIVDQYPKSDHYDKARSRLHLPDKEQDAPPSAAMPPTVAAPSGLATILPAKYWLSKEYSRIVIPASQPVSFTSGVLDHDAAKPHQLFVDLNQSYAAPQHRQPVVVGNGLLRTLQSSQQDDKTVRLTVDLGALTEYKIFSLNDPFRVVVDVYGAKDAAPAAKIEPPAAPPPPQIAAPPARAPVVPAAVAEPVISLTEQKKRSPKATAYAQGAPPSDKEKISLAQQLGLGVRKIVIDPGHGGKDPGAMAFGLKEKDIVLNVTKKIAKKLRTSYRYEVVMTRTKDVYLALEERTAVANRQKSDLFISIHVNAHSDKATGGVETYFLNLATDADAMRVAALENATSTHSIGELQEILANLVNNSKIDESSRLAQYVQTNLHSGLKQKYGTRNLGVKQAPFYVLIGAQMPAILAEISFITNPDEAKLLQDEVYLDKIADQIAAGIVAYVDHHHTAAVRF